MKSICFLRIGLDHAGLNSCCAIFELKCNTYPVLLCHQFSCVSDKMKDLPILFMTLVTSLICNLLSTYCYCTCIPNMQPILIAHRMPSKHSDATCWSSQCCRFTLNAARNGLQVTCTELTHTVELKGSH